MGPERRRVLGQIDVVVALALDGERRVRSIDLHRVAGRDLAHVERSMAGRHAKLHEVGLLVVQAELGPVAGAHEGPWPELHLDVAALTGVEHVAGRQGRIDLGLCPLLSAGPPERHLAVGVAHTGRRDLAGLPLGGQRVVSSDQSRAAHDHGQRDESFDDPSVRMADSLSATGFGSRPSLALRAEPLPEDLLM